MKTLLILFHLFISHPDKEVLIYRDLLSRSESNEETARFYFNKSRSIENGDQAILRGYKAMASIMMCKHIKNPFNKISYFSEGKTELDKAIASDPKNPELIFLRFATQCNTPKFLGYNNQITSDKIFLLEYLINKNSFGDLYLRNKILNFMLQYKYLNTSNIN